MNFECGCFSSEDEYNSDAVKKVKKEFRAKTDKNGNIIIPHEMKKKLGITEGGEVRIIVEKDRIEIFPNIHSLSKVYIEPTSLCNLMCETCVRNTWEEPMGNMSLETFDKLMEHLKECKELETIMFGGIGEPSFHKDILYMIERAKSLGVNVEMTTNGTLLDENMIKGLLENELDTLWVSFDGTTEDVFDDIREGASFNKVVNNLKFLKKFKKESKHTINIGIAFVVMKDNVNELSNINKLAKTIGADRVSVSNVIPYSSDMADQTLCDRSIAFYNSMDALTISLPLIDINDTTKDPLYNLFKCNNNISIMNHKIGTETSKCKFIKERCTFIRWDGKVCPCMGLLHSNTTYPYDIPRNIQRQVTAYSLGDIKSENLKDIWESNDYMKFRDKVEEFDFSPCLHCGPCDFAEENNEDCFGNIFPTCGGCLWAQGVIQCP